MPRIRIIFEKKEWITFVNHMDLPTMFSRAARRTGLIQEFTEGFSPHPHISLGPPLAIGVEGKEEPADFWFKEWDDSNLEEWTKNMPHGIKILKCAEVDGPALAKLATAGTYTLNGCGFELDGRALEILEDEPQMDVIVIPIGGGGLISGIATAAKAIRPSRRLIGAEPQGAIRYSISRSEGKPE